MTRLATKQHVLEDAGYVYNFDREIYVNRKAKKIFSIDFVEDHGEDELEERIRQDTGEKQWSFFFNSPPAEAVRHELEALLG